MSVEYNIQPSYKEKESYSSTRIRQRMQNSLIEPSDSEEETGLAFPTMSVRPASFVPFISKEDEEAAKRQVEDMVKRHQGKVPESGDDDDDDGFVVSDSEPVREENDDSDDGKDNENPPNAPRKKRKRPIWLPRKRPNRLLFAVVVTWRV
jgi:hypothetical protein